MEGRVDRPPRLQLDLPVSSSSFKRTFEELGFELENDGSEDHSNSNNTHSNDSEEIAAGSSSSDEGSPSPSSRNKRARSELSDSGSGASTHNTTPSLNLSPIEGVSPISNTFSSRWPNSRGAEDDNDSMDVEDDGVSDITPSLPFQEPASPPLERPITSSSGVHTMGLPEQDYFPHPSDSSSNATPPWLRPTPPTLTIPTINTAFDSTDTLVNLTNRDSPDLFPPIPHRSLSLDSPTADPYPSLPPIQATLHPRRRLGNLQIQRTNPLFAANQNGASSPIAGPSTATAPHVESPLLPCPPAPRPGRSLQYDEQREAWVSNSQHAPSPSPSFPRSAGGGVSRRRHLGEFLELAPSPSPTTQLGWRFGSGSSAVGSPVGDETLEAEVAESPSRQRPTLFPRTQGGPHRLQEQETTSFSLVLPPLDSERRGALNRPTFLHHLDRPRPRNDSEESRNLPIVESNEQSSSSSSHRSSLTPWGENILRAALSSSSSSSAGASGSDEQQHAEPERDEDANNADSWSERMLSLVQLPEPTHRESSSSSSSQASGSSNSRPPQPGFAGRFEFREREELPLPRPFPLRVGHTHFNGRRLPGPPEPIRWLGEVRHPHFQSPSLLHASAIGARSYRSLMQRPSTSGSQNPRERSTDAAAPRPQGTRTSRRSLHLDLTGFNASFEQDGDLEPYLSGSQAGSHGSEGADGDGEEDEEMMEDADASDDDVSQSSIRATTSITRGPRADDMIEDEPAPAPSLDWPPILPLDSPQPVPRAPSFHRWLNESPVAAAAVSPPPEILFDHAEWAEPVAVPDAADTTESEEPRLTLPSFPSLDLSTPSESEENMSVVNNVLAPLEERPLPPLPPPPPVPERTPSPIGHRDLFDRLGFPASWADEPAPFSDLIRVPDLNREWPRMGDSWYTSSSRPFSRGVRPRNEPPSHRPSSAGNASGSGNGSAEPALSLFLPPLILGDRDLSRELLSETPTRSVLNEDEPPVIPPLGGGDRDERSRSLETRHTEREPRGDRIRMHDLLVRTRRRASDEMHSESEAAPTRTSRWGELQDGGRSTNRTPSAWREMNLEGASEPRPSLTARRLAMFDRHNERPATSSRDRSRDRDRDRDRDQHQHHHAHFYRHHRRMNNGRPSSSEDLARSFSSMEEFLEDFDRRNPVAPPGPTTRPHPRPWRNGLGDFVSDTEWDGSYDNLLRLGAILGEVKMPGTAPEVIAGLPTSTYQEWAAKDEEAEIRCPICLDDYDSKDRLQRLHDCQHWFHRDCLGQWLKSAQSCPVCRTNIKRAGSSTAAGGSSSRFLTAEGSTSSAATRRRHAAAFNWTFPSAPGL